MQPHDGTDVHVRLAALYISSAATAEGHATPAESCSGRWPMQFGAWACGAGKSNLMDAISFVLGVRTSHLRGNLQELLYKYSSSQSSRQSAGDSPATGSVKLVYISGARPFAPLHAAVQNGGTMHRACHAPPGGPGLVHAAAAFASHASTLRPHARQQELPLHRQRCGNHAPERAHVRFRPLPAADCPQVMLG